MILNSLSSIISYSCYDYCSLLGDKTKDQDHASHRQSFIRQSAYTAIITGIYITLTTHAFYMTWQSPVDLHIVDTIGFKHKVEAALFYYIIFFSWFCHAVACIFNICYYNDHPSSVKIDPRGKCDVWLLGKKTVSLVIQNIEITKIT